MTLAEDAARLADTIARIDRFAENAERQAEALLERIESRTVEEAGDGDSLLRAIALDEARSVLRDLLEVVMRGGEFQTGGLVSCSRELVAAVNLAPRSALA